MRMVGSARRLKGLPAERGSGLDLKVVDTPKGHTMLIREVAGVATSELARSSA